MFSLPRLALLSFLTLTNIYWCLFFGDNSSGASTEIIAVYFPGLLSCCVSLSVCAVYWFWDRLAALHPGRSCSLWTHLTRWQDDMFRMFVIDLEGKKTPKQQHWTVSNTVRYDPTEWAVRQNPPLRLSRPIFVWKTSSPSLSVERTHPA